MLDRARKDLAQLRQRSMATAEMTELEKKAVVSLEKRDYENTFQTSRKIIFLIESSNKGGQPEAPAAGQTVDPAEGGEPEGGAPLSLPVLIRASGLWTGSR